MRGMANGALCGAHPVLICQGSAPLAPHNWTILISLIKMNISGQLFVSPAAATVATVAAQ